LGNFLLFCWIYYKYLLLGSLLLQYPWFSGLVFWWIQWVLTYSFHRSFFVCFFVCFCWRESISNNRKEQVFLLVEIRIAIQGVDSH
jgi:hypothetical protein